MCGRSPVTRDVGDVCSCLSPPEGNSRAGLGQGPSRLKAAPWPGKGCSRVPWAAGSPSLAAQGPGPQGHLGPHSVSGPGVTVPGLRGLGVSP